MTQNELESRIKLLEDNAFADRARIGQIENETRELTIELYRLQDRINKLESELCIIKKGLKCQ